MYTIEEVDAYLHEIVQELPEAFFQRLNGGIILLPDCKTHPQGTGDLYIMGDYCNRYDTGRCIRIYYGSFQRTYGRAPEHVLREKLRETLLHEFTHHLESLAGERGLEIKDKMQLEAYKRAKEEGHGG